MTLNTVTLKWDLTDLIESGLAATLTITPTAQMADSADHILIPAVSRPVVFAAGTGQLAGIVANDNPSILPAGTGYLISVVSATGQVIVPQFQTQILFANGATQWLDALAPAAQVTTAYQYLPLPSGVAGAGDAPVSAGAGQASAWTLILQAASNLADLASATAARTNLGLGSAAVQPTSAFDAAGAAAAVQALAALRANNLSDLASAATARTNLGLGTAATAALASLLLAANNLSDLASAATARANLGLGAAALLGTPIPAASLPSLDGITAPAAAVSLNSKKITNLANGSGATDAAAFGQILGLLAATAVAGFALQNATPTILTWTAPADGLMHRVLLLSEVKVATAETGGAIGATITWPDNSATASPSVITGGQATGYHGPNQQVFLVAPGSTFTLAQTSALTAGTATLWAEMWGS